jgi:hypothetical protein
MELFSSIKTKVDWQRRFKCDSYFAFFYETDDMS